MYLDVSDGNQWFDCTGFGGLMMSTIEIISKEDISQELYGKPYAKLTESERKIVTQEWADRLMGRK